ncbi:MAG: hypothetical protein ACUVTX_12185, partial [Bacteroidales bacterium]
CIGIAIYWFIYNFRNSATDWSSWVSSVFLICFGSYMAWTSLGYGYNFIEFENNIIRLKNNSFLPVKEINSSEIDKITIYPLKFVIRLKSSKIILTRFGLTNIERNENIKDEILRFAGKYNVVTELKNET